MVKECTKSVVRRLTDPNFINRYFVGQGIDIGGAPDPLSIHAHQFPLMKGVDVWDLPQGDAQLMEGVPDDHFDFVHSSHCLEHLQDPFEGLKNWFRILKPGGHLVVMVPEEDMYEQRIWPSTFNTDHKWTFTMLKETSWSAKSVNVLDIVRALGGAADIRRLVVLDTWYRTDLPRFDQTLTPGAECGIEIVIRKRPEAEVVDGGPWPKRGTIGAFTLQMLTSLSTELRPPQDILPVAVTRYEMGATDEAEKLARKIIGDAMVGPDALRLLAMCANRRGDDDQAIRYLWVALAMRPLFAEAMNALGKLHEAKSDPARAERAYKLTVAMNPSHAEAVHSIGRLCAEQARLKEATRAFQHIVRQRPHALGALETLIDIRLALRDRPSAMKVALDHMRDHPSQRMAALCLKAAPPEGDPARDAYLEMVGALTPPAD